MAKLLETTGALGLDQYGPQTGRVIATSPTVWYATIRVDKGSSDGVRLGQPVINEEALIGRVTAVFNGAAQVTLLTDTSRLERRRLGARGARERLRRRRAGRRRQPQRPAAAPRSAGREAVGSATASLTRGTVSDTDRLPSLYPRGLPIGVITRIDNKGTDTEEVHLRPFANMRDLDFVQILTRPQGPAAMTSPTPQLIARLVALAIGGVVVQTAAVSQLPIAGANADLSPLLGDGVGLLCGSLAGGCFGFGVGLFVDIVAMQTLGVSSLVLLGVGYGAGRLREARDPEGTLVPLAVGAIATLTFSVGFALMQFLLGVERAGQLGALAPDARDARHQRADRAARLRARAPLAAARRCPRTRAVAGAAPTRPAACRRSRAHDGTRLRPPAPHHPAARAARRDPRRGRARAVRDRLLPPVVPAGAVGRAVPRAGELQPRARAADPGAARQDRRSRGQGRSSRTSSPP